MDTQSYQELVGFTQSASLLLFVFLFAVVLVYALWPRNKTAFDHAARIPLQDDGGPESPQSEDRVVTGKD